MAATIVIANEQIASSIVAGRAFADQLADLLAVAVGVAPFALEEVSDVAPVLHIQWPVETDLVVERVDRMLCGEGPEDQACGVAGQHTHDHKGEHRRAEDGADRAEHAG